MKNYFKMNYEDQEFILLKSSVKFKHGLGIVRAIYNIDSIDKPLIGIVNENFETLYGLVSANSIPKLEIFSNKNLIIVNDQKSTGVSDSKRVLECTINNKNLKPIFDLQAEDFERINEDVIVLTTVIEDTTLKCLFDCIKGEPITSCLNYIGEFKSDKKYNAKVAECSYIIYIDDNDFTEITFCINEFGEVVSNYYDMNTGASFDNSLSLNDIIKFVKGGKKLTKHI